MIIKFRGYYDDDTRLVESIKKVQRDYEENGDSYSLDSTEVQSLLEDIDD